MLLPQANWFPTFAQTLLCHCGLIVKHTCVQLPAQSQLEIQSGKLLLRQSLPLELAADESKSLRSVAVIARDMRRSCLVGFSTF